MRGAFLLRRRRRRAVSSAVLVDPTCSGAAHPLATGWQSFQYEYAAKLSTARTQAKELHRIFSVWRNPRDEEAKVRASASELLGLYGLLKHFVETRLKSKPH